MIYKRSVVLLSTAVLVLGCARRTSLDVAIEGANQSAWEQASPGLLQTLQAENASLEIIVLGNQDEVGLVTGYATPRVLASRFRSDRFAYPLHLAPEGGTAATRQQIHKQELLAGEELCWLADRLEAYLIQVNGSAVLAWVDESGKETGQESTIVWSASNGHGYKSLGRMAIDAGMASEDSMSLDRLRSLHLSHPQELSELMLKNPRYIMFRELSPVEVLEGSRGCPLIPGVSLAADPRYETGALFLIEPTDGSEPFLGLVHDGGAAIVGPQRLDRYFGIGDSAMSVAGTTAIPATVSRVEVGNLAKE